MWSICLSHSCLSLWFQVPDIFESFVLFWCSQIFHAYHQLLPSACAYSHNTYWEALCTKSLARTGYMDSLSHSKVLLQLSRYQVCKARLLLSHCQCGNNCWQWEWARRVYAQNAWARISKWVPIHPQAFHGSSLPLHQHFPSHWPLRTQQRIATKLTWP